MIIPPYLQKGDTIGMICPAGFMPEEKFSTSIRILEQWGYHVKRGTTPGAQFHYFSGTDEQRTADLQQMLDDKNVKAIFCARGGYGLSRMIDAIDFRTFRKNPKWIIGFSDVTVLHAHINRKLNIATLHAPMAGAFNDGGYRNQYVQSLKQALSGNRIDYTVKGHRLNRAGNAKGMLIGGNLALVAHLVGTASAYQTKGKILFLEDVGEYLYNIDRMLIQVKRAGMFNSLAGLIFGGFSDLKDTTTPFGATLLDILQYHVKEYNYPVCYQFPVSHEKENLALKIGLSYRLSVTGKSVRLTETG